MQLGSIVGVQRLAQLEHDVIGDVDDRVKWPSDPDRRSRSVIHTWRTAPLVDALDHAAGEIGGNPRVRRDSTGCTVIVDCLLPEISTGIGYS